MCAKFPNVLDLKRPRLGACRPGSRLCLSQLGHAGNLQLWAHAQQVDHNLYSLYSQACMNVYCVLLWGLRSREVVVLQSEGCLAPLTCRPRVVEGTQKPPTFWAQVSAILLLADPTTLDRCRQLVACTILMPSDR